MCTGRTRTALDTVRITALGGDLNAVDSVLHLLAEDTGEDEGKAVDHVEWTSKELQVHQQRRRTEEPGISRLLPLYTCLPDVA